MAHNKATPVWLVVFPIFKADVYFQTYSFNALSRINEQKRGSNLIRVKRDRLHETALHPKRRTNSANQYR